MKLYLIPLLLLFLNGCAVTYLSDENESVSYAPLSACPSTFSFSGSSDYKAEDIEKGSYFRWGPHTEDYINWVNKTLSEQGCNSKYTDNSEADLAIHVHEYWMSSDRHQGAGILGWLTLFVVPIPSESRYRDVSFTYNGQKNTHKLNEKSWLGWYFIPVHLASYLPHDKYFITGKLEEIINNE